MFSMMSATSMIKGTLQSFPVILMKYWLVFTNLQGKYNRIQKRILLSRFYNRKPAMQTFYYRLSARITVP